ncbi:MAG: hypothetical protein CAF44_012440 [Nitrospira sp. CG24D]|nr:MAG: hypothetical protein CAF44_012440 [Nitrospira sp. CG24D]
MKQARYVVFAGISLTFLTVVTACGVVGAPVAPENVGVNPTIARQKTELKKLGAAQEAVNTTVSSDQVAPGEIKGQDEELPPLRPVGTR